MINTLFSNVMTTLRPLFFEYRVWCTVNLQLSIRGQEHNGDRYENRHITEQTLKN